ncbi:unnamed protein product [Caenorhabditis bovis]|uniref:Uncharacterized protein n=1 Tax=Caenorhabditis bovis TaxID=2654633 RepID=A0A8S1EB08_9PELO|nr:unnamed protein product [Caenorhabditis bovis]
MCDDPSKYVDDLIYHHLEYTTVFGACLSKPLNWSEWEGDDDEILENPYIVLSAPIIFANLFFFLFMIVRGRLDIREEQNNANKDPTARTSEESPTSQGSYMSTEYCWVQPIDNGIGAT